MQIGWKTYTVVGVIAVTMLYDVIRSKENGLELAHRKVGWEVSCKIIDTNDAEWGRCQLGDSSTFTAWKLRETNDGVEWIAGNGKAQQVLRKVQDLSNEEARNLPNMIHIPGEIVSLPQEVTSL